MDLTLADFEHLTNQVVKWARQIHELDEAMATTSGEIYAAYSVIRNDYLYKLQVKIGQLSQYVNGIKSMNPYLLDPPLDEPRK